MNSMAWSADSAASLPVSSSLSLPFSLLLKSFTRPENSKEHGNGGAMARCGASWKDGARRVASWV